jgi:hypothetical protein
VRIPWETKEMSWPRSRGQRFHRTISESREKFRKQASKRKMERKDILIDAMVPSSTGKRAVLNTWVLLLVLGGAGDGE